MVHQSDIDHNADSIQFIGFDVGRPYGSDAESLDGPTTPNCLVHEACWTLLEQVYAPDPVPHRRCWGVCNSLTLFSKHLPYWGHDYGGLGGDLPPDDPYPGHRKRRRNPESYHWPVPNPDPTGPDGEISHLLTAALTILPWLKPLPSFVRAARPAGSKMA